MSTQKFTPRVTPDRFGNPTMLLTAYQKTDKRTGNKLPIYKCTVELKNDLYKIEISHRNKETKSGDDAMWVKITKLNKQQRQNLSM